MTDTNGTPDFTNPLGSFTLNGHTFHRSKVDSKKWAETLARVAGQERAEMKKTEGSVLFGVSAEGLAELIALGIQEADREDWESMYARGEIEFGELVAIRDWLWEKMTDRPFTSDTPSSDGPGSSSDPSSKDESPSAVGTPTA